MRLLLAHSWPGNVRELANAIEHGFVTSRGHAILPADLPDELRGASARDLPPGDEREMLIEALREEKGHRERAAARLGVSRVTLWKRMKKHGVTWPLSE
jgi:transcriptional regulator of acetoin/glycerol metabolism